MHTLPQSSTALSFAMVLLVTLVGFPLGSQPTASAQSNSSQLVCNPCNMNFGNVVIGGSSSIPVTLTNSGSSSITISNDQKNGPWAFSARGLSVPYSLGPGKSVALNIVFAPHTLRTLSGTFTFYSNAANSSLVLSVSGVGVFSNGLTASPSVLGFGSVPMGSTSTQTVTVTNGGSTPVSLSHVTLTSSTSSDPFSLSGLNLPTTLTAGQSLTFSASFTPNASGNESGTMVLSSGDNRPISIALSGAGATAGQLSVTPNALNFGSVAVGASASQNLTLSATSNSVTVTSDSLSSSEYSVSGMSMPLTVPAGKSVPVTVTFKPQSSGAANANVTFAVSSSGNSAGPAVGASLSGTGTAAQPHSVGLAWQASSSQVVGYNVYRGTASGGPYSMITSSDSADSYSDTTVQAGATYYYVVTAVNNNGQESVYSNQAQAVVPSP